MQSKHPSGEYVEKLATLLAQYPSLRMRQGGKELFERCRAVAPELVSSAGTGTTLQVFLLEYDGEPIGGTSYFVQTNANRKHQENLWARIDLVVVFKTYRRLGLARLLVLFVLTQILEFYGDRLYSISCLAAHEAIGKILESIQFVAKPMNDKNFVHAELRVTRSSLEKTLHLLNGEAEKALRLVNYRFHQQHCKIEPPGN